MKVILAFALIGFITVMAFACVGLAYLSDAITNVMEKRKEKAYILARRYLQEAKDNRNSNLVVEVEYRKLKKESPSIRRMAFKYIKEFRNEGYEAHESQGIHFEFLNADDVKVIETCYDYKLRLGLL